MLFDAANPSSQQEEMIEMEVKKISKFYKKIAD